MAAGGDLAARAAAAAALGREPPVATLPAGETARLLAKFGVQGLAPEAPAVPFAIRAAVRVGDVEFKKPLSSDRTSRSYFFQNSIGNFLN